jgi:hypothetical protein
MGGQGDLGEDGKHAVQSVGQDMILGLPPGQRTGRLHASVEKNIPIRQVQEISN